MKTVRAASSAFAETGELSVPSAGPVRKKGRLIRKTAVMYVTMVAVSTVAIFFLEHVTILNAFRTAVVAAIGKTVAANFVSGYFD